MEKYVELKKKNGTLRGMLHLPENIEGKSKIPGVILYHGFTGNRMEPSFIFVRFSRLLAEHGIASVRFDFLNSGESDGSFEKMTLSEEIEDAEDILNYFSSLEPIDEKNIFLLGLSMGGSIAGYVAGKHSKKLKGLILWAPAGEMALFIEEREKLTSSGNFTGNPKDINGLLLGDVFIEDVKQLSILEMTADYRGPATIIHGTGDESVPPEVSRRYKDIFGDRSELTMIDGADHTFQGLNWGKKLFSTSLEFIQKNLDI